jgi:predicted Zn-dependent protease
MNTKTTMKRRAVSFPRWGVFFLACATGVFLLSCQTVPITGRHQLNLISSHDEIKLGESAYKDVMKKSTQSRDAVSSEIVRRVGQRIAKVANRPDYQWEFNLVEEKTPNAFCLPGGKVVVYTGILKYTRDENGLAVVIGHETAHALAHHGAERMSQQMMTQIAAEGVALVLGRGDPETMKSIEQAFGIGAEYGVLLPFSREHESEADHIGLYLMSEAGYDPRGAVAFWNRMMKAGGEKPPEFLSTHPSDEHRVRQIETWLPEVVPIYEKHQAES